MPHRQPEALAANLPKVEAFNKGGGYNRLQQPDPSKA
jgi:hypothetical protein